mgnify:CR=1 FL=1
MYRDSENLIPIVGAPNAGKSTLFNWLTGSRQKTVNYPGSTVEFQKGPALKQYESSYTFIDTPGIYSLFPKSQDEKVTHNILFSEPHGGKIVFVMDATQIHRHLYVLRQLRESGFEVIVALTMMDLVKKSSIKLNLKLLEDELKCKFVPINGRLGGGIKELMAALKEAKLSDSITEPDPWDESKQLQVREDIQSLMDKVMLYSDSQNFTSQALNFSFLLDRFFLNTYTGTLSFLAIMFFLFASIFWFAAPFMDFVDNGFADMATWAATNIQQPLLADFISNGIIASLGAFLVFAPQIFILFLIIGLLEDSGYLARAASLSDKLLSKAGLNGKAFVPLLSGFACAVPAMMATRNMESRKEKFLTLLILPIMTCSARLPVYALLIGFLFWDKMFLAGIVLAMTYFAAIFGGLFISFIASHFFHKQNSRSNFILELPLYRVPMWKNILRSSYSKMLSYIKKAGPIIFGLSLVLWLLSTFPNYQIENGQERFQASYMAQIGHSIEPIFEPMGADWRVGTALISAFAAREVFVGTLATLFNITEEVEEAQSASLLEKMNLATNAQGDPLFTWPSIIALMVFFTFALQCISTTAVAAKESGSWKFALGQTFALNVLAYILAVITYQVLNLVLI